MDLVRKLKLYSFIVLLAACLCLALSAVAQTTAPVLPPGMTGSDTSDPRAKLTPGLYDAGETASGIKHLMLVKKPDAFQLGSDNPDDPRIQKSLTTNLGIGDTSKMPSGQKLVLAQLAFANSDIAFQGNHLFQGNFYGVSIYDISNPANTKLLTTSRGLWLRMDSTSLPNGSRVWASATESRPRPRLGARGARRPPSRPISLDLRRQVRTVEADPPSP